MLIVSHDRHPAGEYNYRPTRLALSIGAAACKVEMRFDGRVWQGTSVRGDVKVMPAGQQRIFRHRDACRFTFIGIDDEEISGGGAPRIARPHAVLRDLPLRHVIHALLAESSAGPTTALFQHAAAAVIVARLRELDGQPSTPIRDRLPDGPLSRVIDYLHARLSEDVSVPQLAAVAGLSPAHFSLLFRNAVGEPPHRHLTRLRVERARELLQRGATPSDAAAAVGFFDQSHLARHMRRLLGVSPARLRRSA